MNRRGAEVAKRSRRKKRMNRQDATLAKGRDFEMLGISGR
jgi:hypothetical protein